MIALCGRAEAHPFGASHFGHLAKIAIEADKATVSYRIEIPTNILMRELSARESLGKIPGKEAFNQDKLTELLAGIYIEIDGIRAEPTLMPVEENGLGNSKFFLFDLVMEVPIPDGDHHKLLFQNGNYPENSAFFFNEVIVSKEVTVIDSTLLTIDDGRLVTDQSGVWSPLETNRVLSIDFGLNTSMFSEMLSHFTDEETHLKPAGEAIEADPMLALLNGELTISMIAFALLASLFFGAAHAISPGHGKALVAGYLVGTNGTVHHAILLGLVVTFSHTISVVLLGVVALTLADTIAPETLFPWIELASGVLVLGLGSMMLHNRVKGLGGHSHEHSHEQSDHSHQKPGILGRFRHSLDHLFEREHSHQPPTEESASLGALLSLGVSGGMVPCPSALVVLLSAISIHRTALGLAMVTAFSLGLGLVLVAIAIAVVVLGERFIKRESSGRTTQILSVASAILVSVIGIGITAKALKLLVG